MNVLLAKNPRNRKFSEKSGAYEQGFRVSSTVLNPGDAITIEQYFTGYGNIKSAKVSFFPIAEIFNKDSSYILHSLKKRADGRHEFGGIKDSIDDTGITLGLMGIKSQGWDESTLFIDLNSGNIGEDDGPNQILTETKQTEAPIKYYLKTSTSILPGPYSVEFHFTYFNGDAWKSSVKKIDFKVQNFFEKHNKKIFVVGIFFSSAAFLKSWIYPILFP